MQLEWDPKAPVTPLGQLVFFAHFLEVSGHFKALCADIPLERSSPNAPKVRDVLGTALLGVLFGQTRYAHLGALRFDLVNPGLLGMQKVASEDSVRRFFAALEQGGLKMEPQAAYEFIALLTSLKLPAESLRRCIAIGRTWKTALMNSASARSR
jgi:hypothetical protein